MSDSATITRNAKSNLAFTLMDLPEEKRNRMACLYAFCRIVDDIVDEPGLTPDERHRALDRWLGIVDGNIEPQAGIEQEVHRLITELKLDREPIYGLIEGCRGDIAHRQPATRREMLDYCYKVACCTGLLSAPVMGASEAAHDYAIALGYALQIVNILRDVAEDNRKHGRIYLPADDMELFGVTAEDIAQQRTDYRTRQLFAYEAALAEKFFAEAEDLYQKLPVDDRNALIPAQAMSLIYHNILEKMQDDEYRVFERRYSVGNFRKVCFLLRARFSNVEMPSLPSIPGISDWPFFRDNKEKEDK